jgi:hypothetical protein
MLTDEQWLDIFNNNARKCWLCGKLVSKSLEDTFHYVSIEGRKVYSMKRGRVTDTSEELPKINILVCSKCLENKVLKNMTMS